jgi:hypothetical protein
LIDQALAAAGRRDEQQAIFGQQCLDGSPLPHAKRAIAEALESGIDVHFGHRLLRRLGRRIGHQLPVRDLAGVKLLVERIENPIAHPS